MEVRRVDGGYEQKSFPNWRGISSPKFKNIMNFDFSNTLCIAAVGLEFSSWLHACERLDTFILILHAITFVLR